MFLRDKLFGVWHYSRWAATNWVFSSFCFQRLEDFDFLGRILVMPLVGSFVICLRSLVFFPNLFFSAVLLVFRCVVILQGCTRSVACLLLTFENEYSLILAPFPLRRLCVSNA